MKDIYQDRSHTSGNEVSSQRGSFWIMQHSIQRKLVAKTFGSCAFLVYTADEDTKHSISQYQVSPAESARS